MTDVFSRLALGAALLLAGAAHGQESDQVKLGATLFQENCALCHGADGRGGQGYANPIWGQGAQIRKFKHAKGLFEYNQMLMPFDDPTKLTDEQKWAVIAYMLANHGVMESDGTLKPGEAATLEIP